MDIDLHKARQKALLAARSRFGQHAPRNDPHNAVVSDITGGVTGGGSIDVSGKAGYVYAVLGGYGGELIEVKTQFTGHVIGDHMIVERPFVGPYPYYEKYFNQTSGGAPTPGGSTGGPLTAVFSYEGVLAVSTGVLRIYNITGSTMTISKVFIAVNTAPAGADITVDVNKNGTTIFTNQANRPVITSGSNTGYTVTIDVSAFDDGDYLSMDIDAVGAAPPGSNLTVHVLYS